MAALGVNIDHVATVRQARRGREPDPVAAAREAEAGGADGITVHLREDRRHINDEDLRHLRRIVRVPLNLEMAATDEMLEIARSVRPDFAMLVPEGRQEVTTEGGLDVAAQEERLKGFVARLRGAGIPTSVFVDPEENQLRAAQRIGAHTCEIHTGRYAHAGDSLYHPEAMDERGREVLEAAVGRELALIAAAGLVVQRLGMRFNAGHGLNEENVGAIAALPGLAELHIGHSIVSQAVFTGLREAVRRMKSAIAAGCRAD